MNNDDPLGGDPEASEHKRSPRPPRRGGPPETLRLRRPQWHGHSRLRQNPNLSPHRLRLHRSPSSQQRSLHVRQHQPALRRDLRPDDQEDPPLQSEPEHSVAHRRLPHQQSEPEEVPVSEQEALLRSSSAAGLRRHSRYREEIVGRARGRSASDSGGGDRRFEYAFGYLQADCVPGAGQ